MKIMDVLSTEKLSGLAAEMAVEEATIWFQREVGVLPGKELSLSAATVVQAFVEGMLAMKMALTDDGTETQFLHDIKRKAGHIIHGKNFYDSAGVHHPESRA